jgi:hypothetical protein
MTRPTSSTTTVAILGADALAEDILARLLGREGYSTKIIEASPTQAADGLLEGVDLLLLTPSLKPDVRAAFLDAMRSDPKTAHIPILPFSAALKVALLDELAASTPWRDLFEELVGQIAAALESAAAGARALLADCAEPPAPADTP